MRTHIAVLLTAAMTLSFSLTGCQNADANASTAEAPLPPAIPVELWQTDRATLHASFTTTTVLEAFAETDVIARVSGIVEEILVEEGDYIEAGQPLARLDSERFEQVVHQVSAELRGVKQELHRLQEMADRQMASADAVERLQANRDTLQARLRLAEIDLESTVIRAPINGVIAKRYVKAGNLIQQHERNTLFHIVDLSTLQAVLHLPERDLSKIAVGQPTELTLYGDDSTVTANVRRISPAVDRVAGTFRVTALIDNQEHRLRAGMFARARINYAEQTDALRIPHYAIIQLDGANYVFVVENDNATRQRIETGLRDGQWVEVTDGLSDGSQIVITGHNNLSDNARVVSVNP